MQQDTQHYHKKRKTAQESKDNTRNECPALTQHRDLPRGEGRAKNAVLSAVLSNHSTTQLYRAVRYPQQRSV